MDHALKVQERAWVTVPGVTIKEPNPIDAGQKVTVIVGMRNSGKSPALRTTSKHLIEIVPIMPSIDRAYFSKIKVGSMAIIGPDTKHTNSVEHDVTSEERSQLIMGKSNLYSFGIVEYTDIFGADHWTTFCYRTVSIKESNLVVSPQGNDADKN